MERNCEPMNKNRIEGAAEQGERAINREALVIKAKRRRSGGCAAKECDPYLMGWSPLPETASECQSGERKFPLIERGDRNEDYDNWH